jgi:hypothetical protein
VCVSVAVRCTPGVCQAATVDGQRARLAEYERELRVKLLCV